MAALEPRSRVGSSASATAIGNALNTKPNPYQPPSSSDQPDSWWQRLGKLFRAESQQRKFDFAAGHAMIYEGIAFFIDPDNKAIAYAASPSADQSDQRMNLIVAETIRVLPFFLADNPHLHSHLVDRKLCVRMIGSYLDVQSEFHREHLLEWKVLEAMLADDTTDES